MFIYFLNLFCLFLGLYCIDQLGSCEKEFDLPFNHPRNNQIMRTGLAVLGSLFIIISLITPIPLCKYVAYIGSFTADPVLIWIHEILLIPGVFKVYDSNSKNCTHGLVGFTPRVGLFCVWMTLRFKLLSLGEFREGSSGGANSSSHSGASVNNNFNFGGGFNNH